MFFFVFRFEATAHDDGVFPEWIVQELAFIYAMWLKLTAVKCLESGIITKVMFNNCNNIFTAWSQNLNTILKKKLKYTGNHCCIE